MTTTTHEAKPFDPFLAGWGSDPVVLGVDRRTFGRLVALSSGTVEHFHSDYFFDAEWIKSVLSKDAFERTDEHPQPNTDAITFYFGFDAWGTAIGMTEKYVRMARKNVYRITVSAEHGEFESSTAWKYDQELIQTGTHP